MLVGTIQCIPYQVFSFIINLWMDLAMWRYRLRYNANYSSRRYLLLQAVASRVVILFEENVEEWI